MKNYLVVGGSTGIGASLVEKLLNDGNNVYATYFRNQISFTHPGLTVRQIDIADTGIDWSFLPDDLSGVVYCPGTLNLRPFTRISPQDFVKDFEIQVVGAVNALQAALPALKNGLNPSIVLFSTVAVQTGFNYHTQVATSKGAIEGLVRSLAAELAPTIRVNAIAPSLTDTPLASKLLSSEEKRESNALRHPLKKLGTAADIAEMCSFLLSDKSSWITGQVMHVDGGVSALKV